MTTRDSHSWYVVALVAWLSAIWTHPDLVERMMEGDRQSWISAIGQLVAMLALYLKGSPLGLSEKGRRKYQGDRVKVK